MANQADNVESKDFNKFNKQFEASMKKDVESLNPGSFPVPKDEAE